MNECLCGSGKEYAKCCGLLISGEKKAESPEELMRSRYTAYAEKNIDYILKTTHPETVGELKREELQEWADTTTWERLEIISSDMQGNVEFVAHYRDRNELVKHHELAQFKQIDDVWYFHDAQFPKATTQVNSAPKIGRNEKCPCGSGKKYKKCCGKK